MVAGEKKRATVHDLARVAGVSLATVDRVLNRRPGVRQSTVDKVEKAIQALGFQRDMSASLLARGRDIRVIFIFPDGKTQFMQNLIHVLQEQVEPLALRRIKVEICRVPALDGRALATQIEGLDPKNYDCAIVAGTDIPQVRQAVDGAVQRGLPILTLVSDLPGSSRQAFVGIDNVAAGRTAASLLGRFCGKKGKIGVLLGSHALTDHAQRLEGFLQVIEAEYPHLTVLEGVEGHDKSALAAQVVNGLIAQHGELLGIYSIGAGNSGLLAALDRSKTAGKTRVVAHELTQATRMGLQKGVIDAVLDQNPKEEIRRALDIAEKLALSAAQSAQTADQPTGPHIPISVFLRDNM